MNDLQLAALRRSYGVQRAADPADAAGQAVLDLGKPAIGETWVIHRYLFRSGAGQTVRLFVGGTMGSADPNYEVDAVTVNPAIGAGDEVFVNETEQVWALVTGVAAGTTCYGSIRYRILRRDVY